MVPWTTIRRRQRPPRLVQFPPPSPRPGAPQPSHRHPTPGSAVPPVPPPARARHPPCPPPSVQRHRPRAGGKLVRAVGPCASASAATPEGTPSASAPAGCPVRRSSSPRVLSAHGATPAERGPPASFASVRRREAPPRPRARPANPFVPDVPGLTPPTPLPCAGRGASRQWSPGRSPYRFTAVPSFGAGSVSHASPSRSGSSRFGSLGSARSTACACA